MRIVLLYTYFTVRSWMGRPRSTPRRVRLQLAGRAMDWWVADLSDFGVLAEVFLEGEYEGPIPSDARLVVDLGAHVGASVVWWRSRCPNAHIVAVEPDPESFARLQRHLGDDPQVRLIQAAIAARSGSVRFLQSKSGWSSRLAADGENGESIDVRALTIGELLSEFAPAQPVDILKVDIEGAEWEILSAPLGPISTVAIELHDAEGSPLPAGSSLDELASKHGMRRVLGRSPEVVWLVRDQGADEDRRL